MFWSFKKLSYFSLGFTYLKCKTKNYRSFQWMLSCNIQLPFFLSHFAVILKLKIPILWMGISRLANWKKKCVRYRWPYFTFKNLKQRKKKKSKTNPSNALKTAYSHIFFSNSNYFSPILNQRAKKRVSNRNNNKTEKQRKKMRICVRASFIHSQMN